MFVSKVLWTTSLPNKHFLYPKYFGSLNIRSSHNKPAAQAAGADPP